jgi:hypothetical protein
MPKFKVMFKLMILIIIVLELAALLAIVMHSTVDRDYDEFM